MDIDSLLNSPLLGQTANFGVGIASNNQRLQSIVKNNSLTREQKDLASNILHQYQTTNPVVSMGSNSLLQKIVSKESGFDEANKSKLLSSLTNIQKAWSKFIDDLAAAFGLKAEAASAAS